MGDEAILQRISELLALSVRLQLHPILEQELKDEKLQQLYEITGKVTAAEATKRLSCSATTVVQAWKRWERLGLVVKDGKSYRKVLE